MILYTWAHMHKFRIIELNPTTAKLKKKRIMWTTKAITIDFLRARPSLVRAVFCLAGYIPKKVDWRH